MKKERKILEAIDKALPKMSDFDKGYFLGVAESVASAEEKRKPEGCKGFILYAENETASEGKEVR